jgi:hypothetical protein
MSKNGKRVGAVVLAAAAVLGAGGAIAGATTPAAAPPTLASIQAKAAAAVSLRVNDLNTAISKANGDAHLGAGSDALVGYLRADIAPLQALGQKIADDTIESVAAADYGTIFTNFRVLALTLPAAHIAGATDEIQNTTVPKLTALSAKAASHVNSSNASVVQPLISDLNGQIAAASNATAGVAATVLAGTPEQWNANHDLLTPARTSLQGADGNVAKARADLKQIAADLKPTINAATTAPPTPPPPPTTTPTPTPTPTPAS